MSTSRIEIPLTLPPPHFDDDATIATARQVVPIKGARKIEGRRKVLTLVPLLIASTFCGALGAIAVNYFERSRDNAAPVTQQPSLPGVSTQTKPEPLPVANAPQDDVKTEAEASVLPKDAEVVAANETTKNESPDARPEDIQPKKSATPAAVKREPAEQDATKLVRKRRVQAADSEIPLRRNRRTASRIEDLFTGPNP